MSTLVFNLSFLNWSKKGERSLLNARLSLGHCWTDMQAMFDNVWRFLICKDLHWLLYNLAIHCQTWPACLLLDTGGCMWEKLVCDGLMASHYETRRWIRGSRCLAPVCSLCDHHNNTLGSGHAVKNVKYNWSITFFRPGRRFVHAFSLFRIREMSFEFDQAAGSGPRLSAGTSTRQPALIFYIDFRREVWRKS